MSTETILIIGGSFAGISAGHFACKHVLPQLPKKNGVTYSVTLVNPAKEFFWRFAAPRACASKQMMPPDRLFFPIEPAFEYAFPQFKFVQGAATHVDPVGQIVSVKTTSGEQLAIPYAALVIATGFTTPSPLFSQTADSTDIKATYDVFQTQLKSAETIVIGGGGPVGVETAGEISELKNGRPRLFASASQEPQTRVRLICSGKKLLPVLRSQMGQKAQKLLNGLGCEVTYNTRVVSTTKQSTKTIVELSTGEKISADLYIDCTGSRPNTSFLPKEWLDTRNKLACHPQTLRVEDPSAGSRVYAVGDVASYTRGGVLDMYDAIPVAMTNLRTDLLSHLSGATAAVHAGDRYYRPNLREQQLVPIGTQKGVGAFNGVKMPSQVVWGIKGRRYMLQMAEGVVKGRKFGKEGRWKPVQRSGGVGLSSG